MRPRRADLTKEFVASFLDYDERTGVFLWKVDRRGALAKKGLRAGRLRKDGYREIMIMSVGYLEHRLAWLLVNGEWPDQEIDHKDGVRNNNVISNLRLATRTQNNRHAKCRGYYFQKATGKYLAIISLPTGRQTVLGTFKTPEEAQEVYRAAHLKYYAEFSPYRPERAEALS